MSGITATYKKHSLLFKRPGGTSRGVLTRKDSWFVFVRSDDKPGRTGVGECSLISGLSIDDRPDFEKRLALCCRELSETGRTDEALLKGFPAIRFGIESAFLDLHADQEKILFPSAFTEGRSSIPINGLIWMGNLEFMKQQIREKLADGFTCLKLKIGAHDFDEELRLLKQLRSEYSAADVELRVDANGAFDPGDALEKLNRLAAFDLHSIEQPVRQGQTGEMARLCELTPLPIALDEELIGIEGADDRAELLQIIRPQYIILKPSLVGGLREAETWIAMADDLGISWWITSALESNIGLNAIAQWTYTLGNSMPQGLGTGQLFSNNIPSPLYISKGTLGHDPLLGWGTAVS